MRMSKSRSTLRETVGGYPSGDRLINRPETAPSGPCARCKSKAADRRLGEERVR